MAKINARGKYELCSVIMERTDPDGDTVRIKASLRSDGAVLARILWWQEPGKERDMRRSSAPSIWGTLSEQYRNRESLVRALRKRRGYEEVSAEQLASERKATQEAATAKRRANMGPAGTDEQWRQLYARADAAGMAAGEAAQCAPMVVVEHVNPLDDRSAIKSVSAPVMDGPCGYAYVTVYPGNCSFAKWAKTNYGWRAAHGGGLQMSVGAFGQSVTRKAAYASAFAAVLREADIKAYGSNRMD